MASYPAPTAPDDSDPMRAIIRRNAGVGMLSVHTLLPDLARIESLGLGLHGMHHQELLPRQNR